MNPMQQFYSIGLAAVLTAAPAAAAQDKQTQQAAPRSAPAPAPPSARQAAPSSAPARAQRRHHIARGSPIPAARWQPYSARLGNRHGFATLAWRPSVVWRRDRTALSAAPSARRWLLPVVRSVVVELVSLQFRVLRLGPVLVRSELPSLRRLRLRRRLRVRRWLRI